MKRVLTPLLIATTSLVACARQAPPAPSVTDQINAQLKSPSSFAVLPEGHGGAQMFVRCQMDSSPEICLVDTGAQSSQANDQDSAIQQYQSLGSTSFGGIDGNGSGSDDLIDVNDFSVAGFSVGNRIIVRAGPGSFPGTLSQNGISGVVGDDVFSQYTTHFDFRNHQLSFTDTMPSSLSRHPLTVLPSHHVILQANVGGVQASGLWDTGSFITLFDESFVKANPSLFSFISEQDSGNQDATGHNLPLRLYQVQKLTLGSLSFSNLTVGVTSLAHINANIITPVQMLIGYNIISQASWYMDFPNGHWSAESTERGAD